MATKKKSASRAKAGSATKVTAKTKSRVAATAAPKKRVAATSAASPAHAQRVKLLVPIFTLLSIVFAIMVFWRYG